MFVSFAGLPKGASTITKGFTCSLQFERVKFVFYKLFPNFLLRRNVDHYTAAWNFFFFKLYGTLQCGTLRYNVDLFQFSGMPQRRCLSRCVGMLRRCVDPYAAV